MTLTLEPPPRGWCPGTLPLILFETREGPANVEVDESSSVAIARVRIR